MSLVAIGLNLLLAALLAAALVVGARLHRKLNALRESQQGFAQAVADLNAAALRAERGLAELRAAGDEAMELLSDRIAKGRELAARLETLTAAAARGEPLELGAAERVRGDRDRLGALLAETQRRPVAPPSAAAPRAERPLTLNRPARGFDDDLFDPPAERGLGALRSSR